MDFRTVELGTEVPSYWMEPTACTTHDHYTIGCHDCTYRKSLEPVIVDDSLSLIAMHHDGSAYEWMSIAADTDLAEELATSDCVAYILIPIGMEDHINAQAAKRAAIDYSDCFKGSIHA